MGTKIGLIKLIYFVIFCAGCGGGVTGLSVWVDLKYEVKMPEETSSWKSAPSGPQDFKYHQNLIIAQFWLYQINLLGAAVFLPGSFFFRREAG